jgi:hypothetical protein
MSPRWRWIVALVLAAAVFAAATWLDSKALIEARSQAAASFEEGALPWLVALVAFAIAAGGILFAGLAWWSRSALVGFVFLVTGLAEFLSQPIVVSGTALPGWLDQPLKTWLWSTSGPMSAAFILGAALAVAGVVALYRWRAAAS